MDSITPSRTSQSAIGALAFAVGAVMIAGQPTWPTQETPSYVVARAMPSYSYFSVQAMTIAKQYPYLNFARDMAALYASLSRRQMRLDEASESAIFEDLDGLYEA